MSDLTVKENWRLATENENLRRQLADAQAACAAIRQICIEEGFNPDSLPSSGRDFLARLEAAEDNRRLLATDLVALADGKDVKTILAEAVRLKLEAAQRTAQAADGLAELVETFKDVLRHKAIVPPMIPGVQQQMEDECDAALAAYRATKERK